MLSSKTGQYRFDSLCAQLWRVPGVPRLWREIVNNAPFRWRGGELLHDEKGEPHLYWHSTDDTEGKSGYHGRWRVAYSPRGSYTMPDRYEAGVEWSLPSSLGAGIRFGLDDEQRITLGLSCYGSLYLHAELPFLPATERRLTLYWSEGSLWFLPWEKDGDYQGTSHWLNRMHVFHAVDWMLGKIEEISETAGKETIASMQLPEGAYRVSVRILQGVYKRAHWYPVRSHRAEVKMFTPIPIPGKGDNAWDLGDDAVYELYCNAPTVSGALGQLYASIMRDRERHGGSLAWVPEGAS